MLKRILSFSRAALGRIDLRTRHGRRDPVPCREPHRGLDPPRAPAGGSGAARARGVRLGGETQRGVARELRPQAARRSARRRPLRAAHVRQKQDLHGDRHRDARARHRRQHGHLQPARCVDAAVASRAEPSGAGAGEVQIRHAEQRQWQLLLRGDPRAGRSNGRSSAVSRASAVPTFASARRDRRPGFRAPS